MKQILYTLLFFCVVAIVSSCRKDSKDIDIKTYDEQQIQAYIKSAGLTGFKRDLSGGDTTGIYYQIIGQGTGKVLDYPDIVALVFTVKSFDGSFNISDTITNHVNNYLGHITQNNLPNGLELAIINVLKNRGTRARLLIPSRLAYGLTGYGTGSSSNTGRLSGNQSLDYYVNVINTEDIKDATGKPVKDAVTGKNINGQDIYDDLSIVKYIAANNLTGYKKTASGLWYKVQQAGTGAAVTPTSIVDIQYTSTIFNGNITNDSYNTDTGLGLATDLSSDSRKGLVEGLQLVNPGAKLSLIMPSRMAYGVNGASGAGIPVNSCMRYEINVISIE